MNTKVKKENLFKKSGIYYAGIGLFILVIGVGHFFFQMTFIQKENLRTVETAAENEFVITSPARQIIEIEPEQIEVKKVEVITIPETVKAPAPRREKETVPARTKPVRKKEARETRAERLRRAERILTGV